MSEETPKQEPQKKGDKKLLRGGVDPDVGKAFRIKPGEVRNPGGRPKKQPITALYEKMLEEGNTLKQIESALRRVIKKGNMAFVLQLREMAERVEGKVTQPVDMDVQVNVTLSEAIRKARERANKK